MKTRLFYKKKALLLICFSLILFNPYLNIWIEISPSIHLHTRYDLVMAYNNEDDIYISETDNEPPTVPGNLTGKAISPTQINIGWGHSIDNINVEGYEIYRGGIYIGRSKTILYSDLGLTPDTTYQYRVAAYDSAGNFSDQSMSVIVMTLLEDDIPPSIGEVTLEDITPSKIIILWTTDEEAISQVEYGTTTAYELTVRQHHEFTIEHRATISGLAPSTTYHFRIRVKDRAENLSLSEDKTFTTLSPFTQDSSLEFNDQFISNNFPDNNNLPSNANFSQGGYRQWGCGYIQDYSHRSNSIYIDLFNIIILLSPLIIGWGSRRIFLLLPPIDQRVVTDVPGKNCN